MKRFTIGLAVLLAACGGGGDQAASEGGGDASKAPAGGGAAATGTMGTATISGTVNFTGTAPANPPIDMNEEPQCKAKHTGQPTDPEVVVNNGKLANVFVYVKSGLPAGATFTAPSEPVVLDQDGCLYTPRVFGAMVGQPIEIRNSDPLLHNIKAVPQENRGFNISQPSQGMKTTRTFNTAEVMVPFECNVHSWMNAWVGVMSHPFFATSGEDGSFRIQGLPAGTYEIEAWHEKFGTKTATVTVPDGGSGTAEFTFASTST